jgi:hypothetical protein
LNSLPRHEAGDARIRLKVIIVGQGMSESLKCDGETIVVNRHGALICTTIRLRVEMEIEIYVAVTDKRATAKVVYIDPERPRVCGIALSHPENIWGLSSPPDDWHAESS